METTIQQRPPFISSAENRVSLPHLTTVRNPTSTNHAQQKKNQQFLLRFVSAAAI
jgi:hypothetical protein